MTPQKYSSGIPTSQRTHPFLTFVFSDSKGFQTDLQALPLAAADKMKNEELSASPIKKQGSAAGGKANYTI